MKSLKNPDKQKASRKIYESTRIKISIRFTPDEMRLIKSHAEKSGTPIATYIHDIALNPKFKITPPRPRINIETKALIQRIGINFNQITRSMNNYYEAKNFDRISADLTDIAKTLRDILEKI